MSIERAIGMLVERIEQLESQNNQLHRKVNNLFREAEVTEVDFEKGLAKVEAHGLPSAMNPWLQRAGAQREWDPPTVGERAILISPGGEPGRGLLLPGGFSQSFPQNHNKGGEHQRDIGGTTINQSGDTITLKSPRIVMEVDGQTMQFDSSGVLWTVAKHQVA